MKTLLCTVPDGSLDSYHAYVPLIPRAEGTRPPPMPLGLIRVLHSMEKEAVELNGKILLEHKLEGTNNIRSLYL